LIPHQYDASNVKKTAINMETHFGGCDLEAFEVITEAHSLRRERSSCIIREKHRVIRIASQHIADAVEKATWVGFQDNVTLAD
jgi:hypothetical protein